jgi:hypothetical protein
MGSFSSGIVSRASPFGALELGISSWVGSGLVVPFGLSMLDLRVCLGEPDASDARGEDCFRKGDPGRPMAGLGASRSFDLPLPKLPNAALRFVDDFLSGEDARP